MGIHRTQPPPRQGGAAGALVAAIVWLVLWLIASAGGSDGRMTTLYEYAKNGPTAALVDDQGNRTEWSYDALGRPVAESKGLYQAPALADHKDAATTIYWAFNANGTLSTITREDGSVLHYPDETGRLSEPPIGISCALLS